jgi:hypothetical protein
VTPGVTIAIPTIPIRGALLVRAVASVMRQTRPVAGVSIAQDLTHAGAWGTRNRALAAVQTEWCGFLDDDDELYPFHCQHLLDQADEHGADMVWGWFDVAGGNDPLDGEGRQYDVDNPHTVPITYLVRTELLHAAVAATGGFLADEAGAWDNQDKPLFHWMACHGTTWHDPRHTWRWHHHQRNTSGLPNRWAA